MPASRYNAIVVYYDRPLSKVGQGLRPLQPKDADVGLWLFVPVERIVSHVDIPRPKISGYWIYPKLSGAVDTDMGSVHFYVDTARLETNLSRELVIAANVRMVNTTMLPTKPRPPLEADDKDKTSQGPLHHIVFYDPASERVRLKRARARLGH
jgi:hypothetical protein